MQQLLSPQPPPSLTPLALSTSLDSAQVVPADAYVESAQTGLTEDILHNDLAMHMADLECLELSSFAHNKAKFFAKSRWPLLSSVAPPPPPPLNAAAAAAAVAHGSVFNIAVRPSVCS